MKLFHFLLLSALLLVPALPAAAHSDHDHKHEDAKPVSSTKARTNAKAQVERLINTKKISASWNKAEVISTEQKKFGKKMEWVVTFLNKAETDAAKQKLYVFLKLSGEYVAANFTGK